MRILWTWSLTFLGYIISLQRSCSSGAYSLSILPSVMIPELRCRWFNTLMNQYNPKGILNILLIPTAKCDSHHHQESFSFNRQRLFVTENHNQLKQKVVEPSYNQCIYLYYMNLKNLKLLSLILFYKIYHSNAFNTTHKCYRRKILLKFCIHSFFTEWVASLYSCQIHVRTNQFEKSYFFISTCQVKWLRGDYYMLTFISL